MSQQVNVGIIGAGRIGKLHARNLSFHLPDANVISISDVYIDAAKKCAKECGIPKVIQDYREMIEDPRIDAIFICCPTETHSRIICEVAAAKKHIFCEKPIDLDIQRIDTALDAVEEAGIKLQIGFNRRFDPSFNRARETINEGKIGAAHIVKITSRDPTPPSLDYVKTSGGLFLDMTIHDFDMSRYLIGEEPVEIYAKGASLVDSEIGKLGDIDTAITTITYQSGALCVIDNSRQAVYGYDQRIEAFGSKGCITVSNREPHSMHLLTRENIQRGLPHYFFLERYQESFINEVELFLKAIKEDQTPLVTGVDGKISVMMGIAAQQSLAERRPISIDTL